MKIDSTSKSPAGKKVILFRTSEEELDLLLAIVRKTLETFPMAKETSKAGERLRAMSREFSKYKKNKIMQESTPA